MAQPCLAAEAGCGLADADEDDGVKTADSNIQRETPNKATRCILVASNRLEPVPVTISPWLVQDETSIASGEVPARRGQLSPYLTPVSSDSRATVAINCRFARCMSRACRSRNRSSALRRTAWRRAFPAR